MSLPSEQLSLSFRQAFRYYPSGVAVLTATGHEGPVALTISSLISVNASPPLVAFSLSSASRSAAELLQADTLVIHFLSQKNRALATLCAVGGTDRFGDGVEWERLSTGEPRYTEVKTWFRALVQNRLSVEGATLVTAEILEDCVVSPTSDEDALVYLNRQWHGVISDDEAPEGASRQPAPLLGEWRFWP